MERKRKTVAARRVSKKQKRSEHIEKRKTRKQSTPLKSDSRKPSTPLTSKEEEEETSKEEDEEDEARMYMAARAHLYAGDDDSQEGPASLKRRSLPRLFTTNHTPPHTPHTARAPTERKKKAGSERSRGIASDMAAYWCCCKKMIFLLLLLLRETPRPGWRKACCRGSYRRSRSSATARRRLLEKVDEENLRCKQARTKEGGGARTRERRQRQRDA